MANDAVFAQPGTAAWVEAWGMLEQDMGTLSERHVSLGWQVVEREAKAENMEPSAAALGAMRVIVLGVTKPLTVMESRVLVGECWQYMGTFLINGAWYHQFRHRHLDLTGQREVRNYRATALPESQKPKLAVAGYEDDGQPF
jgi:hypothetical protein